MPVRGDRLYCRFWTANGIRGKTFRYRMDPVPHIYPSFRGWFHCWYKRPKTTQERRWSFAYGKYVRGKRKACNLPNAWDDYQRSDTNTRRSWKNKKIKRQWMKNIDSNI